MKDIEKMKNKISELAPKYDLLLLVTFGSQARGKSHPKSDVDFGFLAPKRMSLLEIAKMQLEFSEKLKMPNLEMVDLKLATPLLLKNIAQDSILLYQKESGLFERFKIYGIKLFMEAQNLLRLREASLNRFLEKV